MTPAEALRAVCDAWEAGDPDAAAGLFAPDGVYEDPLYPEALTGPEAIRAGMVEGMGAIEDGDRVLAIGFFASKLRDGGARLDFPFAILVELRDGRISRLSEYFDT